MTTRLYYGDAGLREWTTAITDRQEREGAYYVQLEETAYYPEGGGQPWDTGVINGIPVLEVQVDEKEAIWHRVERFPEETEVRCVLDWARRFDHMQQHSGQHLLSAVCLSLHGATTLSFHMGNDYATIDVEAPELSPAQLEALEQEVNRQIYADREISGYFVSQEEAASLPLVKQPKVTSNIRIVEIDGIEYNACGGTHVSSTGAIGIIKLLKAEKQKGHTRIYFKCGGRALKEFNDNLVILNALAAKFNTGKEEILDRFAKWEQEQQAQKSELSALKEQNDQYLAKELLTAANEGVIGHIFEGKTLKDAQNLAVKLAADSGLPVLFLTGGDNKVVLAYSGNGKLSCGAFFKAHLAEYQGKGGGSDKLAQAGFGSREEAVRFYQFALTAAQEAVQV
ncbi:alanyl-tRNA editing protein [Paenibacillus physcomitrellae]|uniref:Alanyl-tRNA editing protein n=1 Tax=Paenibacillus physcomitrellae TaxID=1619311 RepID=A0ABQ1GS86_9BACL|nr:alanyl-tRNA editing protein [Paenibacillus physcomitrellae]GGA49062.1 alanyl-tRNA editing protein [Paenibacillus physcomitrellae]